MPDSNDPHPFAELGLRPELVRAVTALGYEEPTPVQREAIPLLLQGQDLLGQAATGTGKTAAFALPILQRSPNRRDRTPGPDGLDGPDELDGPDRASRDPFALVLVPTRELCMQVCQALHRYGQELGTRVLAIYGGQPMGRQLRELASGVDVVVATPGRLLDHLTRATLSLDAVRVVVLDEADEMLDMGFADDLEAILLRTPPSRQTVLLSATLPARITGIVARHLQDPVRVRIARAAPAAGAAPQVRQVAFVVARAHKPAALGRLLDVEAPASAIVFCRTRQDVDQLAETLTGRGHRAQALHGGMSQEQRGRVMTRVRSQTADLLVATDVAARGLDIEHLTHVVNYEVPSAAESYVHRIGRVGRGDREGVAITLAEPREQRMLQVIERATGQRIGVEKLPTVADLRARRLELTRAAMHRSLLDDDLEPFRVVVESLGDDVDIRQIALAAVKVAHDAAYGVDIEEEIPEPVPRRAAADGKTRGRSVAAPRGPAGRGRTPSTSGRAGTPATSDRVRLYVSAGRQAGVRPQDLVGAIAGESRLSGRDIGAIEITERFSLVEIPAAGAAEVVAALRTCRVKGRKVTVRLDRTTRRTTSRRKG
ncbi:MAG: DEAD/DEAH box helicase [Phycicoccus sp.]